MHLLVVFYISLLHLCWVLRLIWLSGLTSSRTNWWLSALLFNAGLLFKESRRRNQDLIGLGTVQILVVDITWIFCSRHRTLGNAIPPQRTYNPRRMLGVLGCKPGTRLGAHGRGKSANECVQAYPSVPREVVAACIIQANGEISGQVTCQFLSPPFHPTASQAFPRLLPFFDICVQRSLNWIWTHTPCLTATYTMAVRHRGH
ncbi:hypothetical protein QBC33DRAFT_531138 [Phialemonium atrogriseum]|uniref:Uncharacterized protein n=1 Tax=Phialemonium atrogriseum TaxID=1093897 RepID=A0AAJ0C5U9_9PEZI|nr:uncharacterized protein QBC33DRAFT_531138 [Phialemonium atrogriseum]KAK1769548.1 hypothetical protein QBC33DRAFT_531138 [Phialemonium atrogriseum]